MVDCYAFHLSAKVHMLWLIGTVKVIGIYFEQCDNKNYSQQGKKRQHNYEGLVNLLKKNAAGKSHDLRPQH